MKLKRKAAHYNFLKTLFIRYLFSTGNINKNSCAAKTN